MIIALIKALNVFKYRWVVLTFDDGTRLVGVVTHETWKKAKDTWLKGNRKK